MNNNYILKTEQNSCYNLDYNPPKMSTIVEDYKVSNYSQPDIDKWLKSLGIAPQAEVCMKIERTIHFELGNNKHIISEKWSIDKSAIKLKPNNKHQPIAENGG
jgi:hypothetical protein